tara:strand:- start:736 stop:909 length:174 start_codon:yes stop_codon:yes gene_type:complete
MKHIFMVLTMFIITIVNAQETITGIVTDTDENTLNSGFWNNMEILPEVKNSTVNSDF